jgi:hypothetical protein
LAREANAFAHSEFRPAATEATRRSSTGAHSARATPRLGHSSKYLLGVSPGRVAKLIFAELDTDKEHFVPLAVALNNKNRISGYKVITTGTRKSVICQDVQYPTMTL